MDLYARMHRWFWTRGRLGRLGRCRPQDCKSGLSACRPLYIPSRRLLYRQCAQRMVLGLPLGPLQLAVVVMIQFFTVGVAA